MENKPRSEYKPWEKVPWSALTRREKAGKILVVVLGIVFWVPVLGFVLAVGGNPEEGAVAFLSRLLQFGLGVLDAIPAGWLWGGIFLVVILVIGFRARNR